MSFDEIIRENKLSEVHLNGNLSVISTIYLSLNWYHLIIFSFTYLIRIFIFWAICNCCGIAFDFSLEFLRPTFRTKIVAIKQNNRNFLATSNNWSIKDAKTINYKFYLEYNTKSEMCHIRLVLSNLTIEAEISRITFPKPKNCLPKLWGGLSETLRPSSFSCPAERFIYDRPCIE